MAVWFLEVDTDVTFSIKVNNSGGVESAFSVLTSFMS